MTKQHYSVRQTNMTLLLRRRLRQRERLTASMLFICSSVCRQNAIFWKTKQFRAGVYCQPIGLRSYVIGLVKEPIIGSLKSKMAEIRHLENGHDVIFFCRQWSDLDKISETGAERHWRQCGRNWNQMKNSNMADVWANSMACHPRATYHIAGCCYLVNSLSRFQSHVAGCINWHDMTSPHGDVMIVPHCRV